MYVYFKVNHMELDGIYIWASEHSSAALGYNPIQG